MQLYPILLALLSAVLFGAATPVSKLLLEHFNSFELAGLLYLGAALGVAPILLKEIQTSPPPQQQSRKNKLYLAGAIACGGILGPVFLLMGLRLASAASVSLWLNLEMVATALLGYWIFSDRLGRFGWLGMLGMLFSACLLVWGEQVAGVQAGLLVGLGCLCWGIDNHLTALIDHISPTRSTAWKGLIAGVTNLSIGLAISQTLPTTVDLLLGLVVGVFAYGFSIVLYIMAAQNLGATRAQLVFATAPFWGIILSVVLLKEVISPVQYLAIAIALLALAVIFLDRHAHEHNHSAIAHEHSHSHDDGHHHHVHSGAVVSILHSHWHEHEAVMHSHPHLPDIHHRHQH
jgi:drug/metabolite transporter (DMT)-like permease